ncbi:MAG: hypothetical protein RIQ56_654 [Candidatus Parcubacteria bacterium]
MMPVRVRFPPSPTGFCHVGTARMAILNFLFAKRHGGSIVFRSEDTDKERSKKEFEEDITQQLQWLGLSWDEFYRQSELLDRHKLALQKLIGEGKAYVSEEESKKDPSVKVQVVRLRNPGSVITFTDLIRGDITFDTTELKDFVIARSIDDPVYHLAVVVDDGEMSISHVIRGEDHISNTPRQILIQEALGYPRPAYAHYPLHLSADRSKLSKRTGDVAVRSYRDKGYLPSALLNYIAVLGWTPPSGREILSLEEMISEFEIGDLHSSGAVFDIEKLRWFNRQYVLNLDAQTFAGEALAVLKASLAERNLPWSDELGQAILPIVKDRTSVWEDIRVAAAEGEFDFFFSDPTVSKDDLPERKSNTSEAQQHLEKVYTLLSSLSVWDEVSIKDSVWQYATEVGRGAVLWPFRFSLTGRAKSPDPFVVSFILGKDATLRRLQTAITVLKGV